MLFPDRIERVKSRAFGSFSRANQDAEVIPVRSISSVQAKKDGIAYTKVIAHATGNTIEFRLSLVYLAPADSTSRYGPS
jgi:hypothetical protein